MFLVFHYFEEIIFNHFFSYIYFFATSFDIINRFYWFTSHQSSSSRSRRSLPSRIITRRKSIGYNCFYIYTLVCERWSVHSISIWSWYGSNEKNVETTWTKSWTKPFFLDTQRIVDAFIVTNVNRCEPLCHKAYA